MTSAPSRATPEGHVLAIRVYISDQMPDAPTKTNLLNLTPAAAREHLTGFLARVGQPAYRARQIVRHLWLNPAPAFAAMTDLPLNLREQLDDAYTLPRLEIAARQKLVAIEPFRDKDGIGRCRLVMETKLVPVSPRPMRAFQGWRYLDVKSAPPDLRGSPQGLIDMPEPMRKELRELGLL